MRYLAREIYAVDTHTGRFVAENLDRQIGSTRRAVQQVCDLVNAKFYENCLVITLITCRV